MVIKIERTNNFLRHYGEKLNLVEEIEKERGLIAVVDIIGGFFSFENMGFDGGLVLNTYYFKDPKIIYYADILEDNEINQNSELWGLTSEGGWSRRKLLNMGTLERGVYKITSEDLINRIQSVFADSEKKVKFE